MKSQNCAQNREKESDMVEPTEEVNEKYDEFDTVNMPIAKMLSKSPLSDEGIEELDSERKRSLLNRCWSLDSAVPIDDDFSPGVQQIRKQKLQVTRCCSFDSAVLSDDDQIKGWDNSILSDNVDYEPNEGKPRYWRTPSVVVSDYSDYSFIDERFERSDPDLEKFEGHSGTPSQASSCSCLDCDEIREEFREDNHLLQVCRHRRRHSDSSCLCISSTNASSIRNIHENGTRRNSCLGSSNPYFTKLEKANQNSEFEQPYSSDQEKISVGFLNIPPVRKISDCSTNSSLSGDDFEVTELQPVKPCRIKDQMLGCNTPQDQSN